MLVKVNTKCSNFNTLRPRQNGRHFPDDIFKCTFLNEKVWISLKISLKIVPKGPINNIPALVQIMAWRRPGDKPLSEPRMVSLLWDYMVVSGLLTHICVTRPQWVKRDDAISFFQSITQIKSIRCTWNNTHFTPECGSYPFFAYKSNVRM